MLHNFIASSMFLHYFFFNALTNLVVPEKYRRGLIIKYFLLFEECVKSQEIEHKL